VDILDAALELLRASVPERFQLHVDFILNLVDHNVASMIAQVAAIISALHDVTSARGEVRLWLDWVNDSINIEVNLSTGARVLTASLPVRRGLFTPKVTVSLPRLGYRKLDVEPYLLPLAEPEDMYSLAYGVPRDVVSAVLKKQRMLYTFRVASRLLEVASRNLLDTSDIALEVKPTLNFAAACIPRLRELTDNVYYTWSADRRHIAVLIRDGKHARGYMIEVRDLHDGKKLAIHGTVFTRLNDIVELISGRDIRATYVNLYMLVDLETCRTGQKYSTTVIVDGSKTIQVTSRSIPAAARRDLEYILLAAREVLSETS